MLVDEIKTRMTSAMKTQDQPRKDIYRFLKGKLDQMNKPSDEVAIKLVRSLLKEADANPGSFSEIEIQEMTSLVPVLLDSDQTAEALKDVSSLIVEAKSEGMAMGIAMKALKGQYVDSEIVKNLILNLRTD